MFLPHFLKACTDLHPGPSLNLPSTPKKSDFFYNLKREKSDYKKMVLLCSQLAKEGNLDGGSSPVQLQHS